MSQITHKKGDTFSLSCVWTDSTGAVIPLTGYTITSKVKVLSGTTFEDTLTVTVIDANAGTFTLSGASTSTAAWPITSGQYGRMYCDIQFVKAGITTTTETFEIVVVQDIT